MPREVHLQYRSTPAGGKFTFKGHPLVLLLILLALTWLFLVIVTSFKLARDYYFPYEGSVLEISRPWYDHLIFEYFTWEHLIIKTPAGGKIDRLILHGTRLANRIETGDYIIKSSGFGNYPRPRDKKTSAEIIADWQRGATSP